MIASDIVVAVISSAGATGVITGVMAYVKDRKKDLATAKLTDVQALQQQVALMETVTRFLRDENERLQKDYEASEAARRAMRQQMIDLQDELQKVKFNAAQTQAQCDVLSRQLKSLIANQGDDTKGNI